MSSLRVSETECGLRSIKATEVRLYLLAGVSTKIADGSDELDRLSERSFI